MSLFFKLFKRFFKNTSTITGCFNDLLFSYSSSSSFRLLHKAALTQRVWNNAKAQMTEKPLCLGRQLHYLHSKQYNYLLLPIILQNLCKCSDTLRVIFLLNSLLFFCSMFCALEVLTKYELFDWRCCWQRGRKDSVSSWANAWTKQWVQF